MLVVRNDNRHTASGCVFTTTYATRQKQVDIKMVTISPLTKYKPF